MRIRIATTSETKCFYIYNSCQQTTTTNISMCSFMLKDSLRWRVGCTKLYMEGVRLVRESSLCSTKRTNKGFFSVSAHHFVIYYSIHRNDFNVDHLVFSFYLSMIFYDCVLFTFGEVRSCIYHIEKILTAQIFTFEAWLLLLR